MQIPKLLRHTALKGRRRALLASLASAFRRSEPRTQSYIPDDFIVNRILVIRVVHSLGNLLGLTSLMAELEDHFPGAEVELLSSVGVAHDLLCNFPQFGRVHRLPRHPLRHPVRYLSVLAALRRSRYDLVVSPSAESNSERLLSRITNGRFSFSGTGQPQLGVESRHFAKRPVMRLRHFLEKRPADIRSRVPPLDIRLDESELRWGENALARLVKLPSARHTRTIALFTGGTGDKRLDREWWRGFYEVLQERLAACRFVEILPADGGSGLSGRIPTYYSTRIRRIGAVIAATDAFIGADSGITHLASAVNVPTIGLFSGADPDVWYPLGRAECTAISVGAAWRKPAEAAGQVLGQWLEAKNGAERSA